MQPDTRYTVKILSAELAESTKKGTDALDIVVEITEGDCAGETAVASLWLTENARDQVKRTLKDLGVTPEQLASEQFWRSPGKALAEKPASIVTEADDFGEVRVRYLNGPARARNKPASDPAATAKRAASLFAQGKKALVTASASAPDDDIPF